MFELLARILKRWSVGELEYDFMLQITRWLRMAASSKKDETIQGGGLRFPKPSPPYLRLRRAARGGNDPIPNSKSNR